MKRFLLMMAVIFSAALSVHAQRTITGTIVDQATNEPLMAVPNFMAMVPLEKMRPVLEVPFFSVA